MVRVTIDIFPGLMFLLNYDSGHVSKIFVSCEVMRAATSLGGNVEAIKYYRAALGVGLKEAKDIHDYLKAKFPQ